MKVFSRVGRRLVSRLAISTGALALAAGVVATTVPSANAAVTSGQPVAVAAVANVQSTVTPDITATTSRAGGTAITCRMVYQGANGGLPHHSGHYPGSINVRVRVTCTKPVAGILGYVVLFQISNKGKILRRTSPQKYSAPPGKSAASGNAALVCKPGYYEGDSVATVTFPPGYAPHTGLLRDYTNVAHIAKC